MYRLLARIWKLLKGAAQWRILWLFHDKFMLGICGIVLNDENELLLLRHRFWKSGSWGLPSGYAKKGEKVEETLARELKEETSLQLGHAELLRIVSGYKLRLEIVLVGRAQPGVVRLDEGEVLEAKYFKLSELPQGLLESHRQFVATAIEQGKLKNLSG